MDFLDSYQIDLDFKESASKHEEEHSATLRGKCSTMPFPSISGTQYPGSM